MLLQERCFSASGWDLTFSDALDRAEHNVLRHICYETVDTGAFYVGRSWSQRGNIVRFNTFDTVRATERLAQKSCSQNAFYLDDREVHSITTTIRAPNGLMQRRHRLKMPIRVGLVQFRAQQISYVC